MNPLLCQLSYAAVCNLSFLMVSSFPRLGKRPGAMQGLAVNRVRSERKQP